MAILVVAVAMYALLISAVTVNCPVGLPTVALAFAITALGLTVALLFWLHHYKRISSLLQFQLSYAFLYLSCMENDLRRFTDKRTRPGIHLKNEGIRQYRFASDNSCCNHRCGPIIQLCALA
jgi:hypothetical protein